MGELFWKGEGGDSGELRLRPWRPETNVEQPVKLSCLYFNHRYKMFSISIAHSQILSLLLIEPTCEVDRKNITESIVLIENCCDWALHALSIHYTYLLCAGYVAL